MIKRIKPRTGVAIELASGDTLRVIDPNGGQVCDLLAVSHTDAREILSNGRTLDYEESIKLTTGSRLWSNRSNPMLTIIEDTVGMHDFLLTPCSTATFKHFYPDKPVHRGCFGNLAQALASYGVEPDDIPTAFNVFMHVPVRPDGRLSVEPPLSKAGDFIRVRAEMDLVVGLTACAAYASNGGAFKPIDYCIERGGG